MPDYAADDVDVIYARIQEIRKELKYEQPCEHTWKQDVCINCQQKRVYDDDYSCSSWWSCDSGDYLLVFSITRHSSLMGFDQYKGTS